MEILQLIDSQICMVTAGTAERFFIGGANQAPNVRDI